MVTETGTTEKITQEEIDAVKAQLQSSPDFDLEALKTKNSAVLTVMMPLPLRVMIDDAALAVAKESDPTATEGSAADWARILFANALGYTLPTKGQTRAKKDKRSVQVQQMAQRSMIADLIAKARTGEIEL